MTDARINAFDRQTEIKFKTSKRKTWTLEIMLAWDRRIFRNLLT